MQPDGSSSMGKAFEAHERLVSMQMCRRHAHACLLWAHSIYVCLGSVRHMHNCCRATLPRTRAHGGTWECQHGWSNPSSQQAAETALSQDVQMARKMYSSPGQRHPLESMLVRADCSAVTPLLWITAAQSCRVQNALSHQCSYTGMRKQFMSS